MAVIRVLITDDHPLFRKGLRTLLESSEGLEVVGEAATAAAAVVACGTLLPDLVLMDLQMPGGSGINAIREIGQEYPETRILVLSLYEDDNSVFAALRAGARGYVLKDADETEIIRAIQVVAGGDSIFSSSIAGRIIALIPRDAFPELSSREREILGLLAAGQSPREIASQLFLSPKTVSNYISLIINKLQVVDRAEAVIRAREAGFGLEE
jgi:DNA-binding NarL/FixJ family response regulator